MNIFLTVVAVVFLILTSTRIYFLLFGKMSEVEKLAIKMAETYGYDPVAGALKLPAIVWIVCLCWIVSRFFQ